jgi:hypothetical protein
MTKRILALLLALTMVFSVLPTGYALDSGPAPEAKSAAADAPADPDNPATPDAPAAIRPGDPVGTVYEGTCGDALSWSLDDATGVLTVTGTGDMYDYSSETPAPWYDQRGSIKALSLPEGLSSIGAYAFNSCDMLKTAVVPDSVQTIGSYAFARCIKLSSLTLPAGLTAISPYMLYMTYNLKTVVVPPAVTEIGDYAFASNAVYSLDRLVFRGPQPATVAENVFENRFRHAQELNKMGAENRILDRTAIITGTERLHGASVTAHDLRGGAALVLAGLSADGETVIGRAERIERGYERMDDVIASLGGSITRKEKQFDHEEKTRQAGAGELPV